MTEQLSAYGGQRSGVSAAALRVLGSLRRMDATAPERAVPDGTIAREAGVSVRDVIDLAEELTEIDVAVLATCGRRAIDRSGGRSHIQGRSHKGRFICVNPAWVRIYAEKLHKRARAIHGRAARYSALAERMDARREPADSTGQRRMFA